jgi:hypothetical protein
MASFQSQLALRSLTTIVGASIVAVVLASEPEAIECKPSTAATHLTHLEALMIQHDVAKP